MQTQEHELSIMDHTGDIKIKWKPNDREDVKSAKKAFEDFTAKNYVAYSVQRGKPHEIVRTFDPSLKKLIMVPPVVGG